MLVKSIQRFFSKNAKFNVEAIMNKQKTPEIELFVNGNWLKTKGSTEPIPYALNKDIIISNTPCLDLPEEKQMIINSMKSVSLKTPLNNSVQNPDSTISTKTLKNSEKSAMS